MCAAAALAYGGWLYLRIIAPHEPLGYVWWTVHHSVQRPDFCLFTAFFSPRLAHCRGPVWLLSELALLIGHVAQTGIQPSLCCDGGVVVSWRQQEEMDLSNHSQQLSFSSHLLCELEQLLFYMPCSDRSRNFRCSSELRADCWDRRHGFKLQICY